MAPLKCRPFSLNKSLTLAFAIVFTSNDKKSTTRATWTNYKTTRLLLLLCIAGQVCVSKINKTYSHLFSATIDILMMKNNKQIKSK